MGMAASQARFLGLTSRKSNVEYQGQQVNQQRTALANESAGLYSQMMELTVPTPPSTSDFYTTIYELEDSASAYTADNYTISNLTKAYGSDDPNKYTVTLGYKTKEINGQSYPFNFKQQASEVINEFKYKDNEGTKTGQITKYSFSFSEAGTGNSYSSQPLSMYGNPFEEPMSAATAYGLNAYTGEKNKSGQATLSVEDRVIYKVDPNRDLEGKEECCTEKNEDGTTKNYYFYRINGNTYFLTEDQLKNMMDAEINSSIGIETKRAYTQTHDQTKDVIATIEKSSTGRLSSIQIEANDEYPASLSGKQFNLNAKREFDQDGYDDAMNDYNFQKDLYEKAIDDINAKTEKIQSQDRNLEIRLNQLDTEQNAIKTEMDSVTKVIEDNVEKTFKTFA